MKNENKNVYVLVVLAFIATGISFSLGGGVLLSLLLLFILAIAWLVVSSMIEKKRRKEKEAQLAAAGLSDVDVHKEFQQKYQSMVTNKTPYEGKKVVAAFTGMGGTVSSEPLVGTITKEGICITSRGEVAEYVSIPVTADKFKTFRGEGKQHNTVMMDVDQAARVGYGLGGLGAGAYAASKAAQINAEGGQHVTTKIKVDRLAFESGDFMMHVLDIYLYKNGKFIKQAYDPCDENARKMADTLNELCR